MLKFQQVGHLMQRADSLETTLKLGKIEGRRRRGRQRMRWLEGITLTQWTWVWEGQGSLECCSPWGHKEPDTTKRLNEKDNRNILYKEGVMLTPSSQSDLAIKSSNPYRVLGKCQPSWLLKAAENWPRGFLFQGRAPGPLSRERRVGLGPEAMWPLLQCFHMPHTTLTHSNVCDVFSAYCALGTLPGSGHKLYS